jgi:hypothetical protein
MALCEDLHIPNDSSLFIIATVLILIVMIVPAVRARRGEITD